MGAIIAELVETGEKQDGRGRRRNSAERKEELLRAFRESLNRELLANVLEAQCVARTFRDDCNSSRPHSLIQQRTPGDYRAELLATPPTPVRPAKPGLHLRRQLAIVPNSTHSLGSNQQPVQSLIVGGPRS